MHFTLEECKSIKTLSKEIGETHSKTLFAEGSIDYYYMVLERGEKTQWIFDRIKEYLNPRYPDNSADKMPCIFVHRYPAGCAFSRHRDDIKYPDQILNVGCLLDDRFSGGDFLQYEPDNIIEKEVGKLYSMKASRPHEVTKITEGVRWSFILFFTKKQLSKASLL